MTAEIYLRRGRQRLARWASEPRVRTGAMVAGYALAGFLMSAASLLNHPLPMAMGLICAVTGWRSLVMALGSAVGYRLFWGAAGVQGVVWSGLGCLLSLFLGKRKAVQDAPLLLSAVAAFLVSATGLAFQVFFQDDTVLGIYLLRVALAGAGTKLYSLVVQRQGPTADRLGLATAVLALAQIAPVSWLNLGFIVSGAIGAAASFTTSALAGLALDLAQITQTPMTGVLCGIFLVRMIPGIPKWLRCGSPGVVYLLAASLCGVWDLLPIPGLVLGGGIALFLKPAPEAVPRRGETGLAQVRLELMAGVLGQTQQILLETPELPVDETGLLARTKERACGSCPNRKSCRDLGDIPKDLLHKPILDTTSLPFPCRKPGRMVQELRRTQEQLRSMRGDRERQREYREAVIQQYQFLGEYLRQLADELPRRGEKISQCYQAEVTISSTAKETANGDRCQYFTGTGGKYYVLLCDGMGTGLGAAQEGQTALTMLRQMLTAGFPAEYALRSINSLCCLRGRAGAVTVDLLELRLDSGKASIYKWGAAASYLLRDGTAEKIGTVGPPPGISVTDIRETVDRLSLRRGAALILCSDGVDGEGVLRRRRIVPGEPPGELAAELLEKGTAEGADDATVAVIRLHPTNLST